MGSIMSPEESTLIIEIKYLTLKELYLLDEAYATNRETDEISGRGQDSSS